jgi:hypothetical protein
LIPIDISKEFAYPADYKHINFIKFCLTYYCGEGDFSPWEGGFHISVGRGISPLTWDQISWHYLKNDQKLNKKKTIFFN